MDENLPPAPPVSGRRVSGSLRSAIEWTLIVVGALVVALIVKATVLQAFYIPSESMTPTLKVGDRVLVNKLSYHVHAVHRGDVVVFRRPPKEEDPNVRDLIKRVIGLPRETIEARDGIVYIDGRRLHEPYVHGEVTENLPQQVVPPGHYWVMGDNRINSRDSRVFGAIPRSLIVGRAFIQIWPLRRLRLL